MRFYREVSMSMLVVIMLFAAVGCSLTDAANELLEDNAVTGTEEMSISKTGEDDFKWDEVAMYGLGEPNAIITDCEKTALGTSYFFKEMDPGEAAAFIMAIKDLGFTEDARETEYSYNAHNGKNQCLEFDYYPRKKDGYIASLVY